MFNGLDCCYVDMFDGEEVREYTASVAASHLHALQICTACMACQQTASHDLLAIITTTACALKHAGFCRYGSYEICNDPYLSANRLSLIDRGFVFALAHVRGGGEMGRTWYEDGKYLNKKNTFTDFIACAEYLVKEKWTSPAHLCIEVNECSTGCMKATSQVIDCYYPFQQKGNLQ